MMSEREREARELRAKGIEIAQIIKSTADKENSIALAEANTKVQILISEGELEANKIYTEAFSKDKEFFAFFQSLEAYRTAFDSKNSTFVISPKNEFFNAFNAMKGARQ
jgi:membrane protease subunit HflC